LAAAKSAGWKARSNVGKTYVPLVTKPFLDSKNEDEKSTIGSAFMGSKRALSHNFAPGSCGRLINPAFDFAWKDEKIRAKCGMCFEEDGFMTEHDVIGPKTRC